MNNRIYEEAAYRLDLMEVCDRNNESIAGEYKLDGTVYVSIPNKRNDNARISKATPQEMRIIKDFNNNYKALAYHMIRNKTQYGVVYSVLYVSDYNVVTENWLYERNAIEKAVGDELRAYAYCYFVPNVFERNANLEGGASEVVDIAFKTAKSGGLLRLG